MAGTSSFECGRKLLIISTASGNLFPLYREHLFQYTGKIVGVFPGKPASIFGRQIASVKWNKLAKSRIHHGE
jgi:hypothetical protein